jgi:hypothetical protein
VVRPILLAAPLCGRSFCYQALVLASRTENLCPDFNLWSKVEDHRVSPSNGHAISGLGAKLEQPVFDADPIQPVGEIANGLCVREVGLTYPPFRFDSAYPP